MSSSIRFAALLHWFELALRSLTPFDQVLKSQATVRTRQEIEHMVMTNAIMAMAGIPLAPSRLSLGLLPYLVPLVYQWRRTVGDERDITSELNFGC